MESLSVDKKIAGPAINVFWPLLALAVGAFGIGTTEFAPMGLLPVIATGVGVSIPTAGLLVSAYAVGVMLGAPIMTLAFGRLRAKTALIALMAIFTLGNLLSAIAFGYWSLLVARIITSLNHGAFFGLGSVVAASIVPKERQASAIATMLMGLTIANVGGVPAATWVGETIGWRMAFAGTAGLGVLAMLILFFALPPGETSQMPAIRQELKVLVQPVVLNALATTVFGAGAMFTLYTYVSPTLRNLTHATPTFITAMLVLIGIGFTIGNALGGKLADRSLVGSLVLFFSALAVIMLVFPWIAHTPPGAAIGLLLWGIATFAIIPPIQMRVMQAAREAPRLASSVNIGAFNLGNAVGATLGGAVLSLGWGYAAVSLSGALLAVGGLLLVVGAQIVARSRKGEYCADCQ